MSGVSPSAPSPAEAYESYMVPGMFIPFVADLLTWASPQSGERVLDLACGTGIVARRIAPLVAPDGVVDALDLSADMLTVARAVSHHEGARCRFHQGTMERLPFTAGTYDLVTCQQGLQFVPDPSAAVREMRRVLRMNGRAVVSCWSGIDQHPLSLAVVSLMERYGADTDLRLPFSRGDAVQLRRLFETAGFDDIGIQTVTRPVQFPDPERYVAMAVSGAIAANPQLQHMPDAERLRVIEAVRTELEPRLQDFVIGDAIVSTKQTHIVRAQA